MTNSTLQKYTYYLESLFQYIYEEGYLEAPS